MKRILLIAVIVMTAYTIAGARQLTPDEALARIPPGTSMASLAAGTGEPPAVAMTMNDGKGSNTLYVINRGSGYVILPADDAVSATVLGYGDTGSFDATDVPEGMMWWLQGYSDQIAHTIASPASDTSGGKPRVTRPDIEPLVTCEWSQGDPYNRLTPTIDGQHAVTGCVATAMSMMMYYYKYPAGGTGSNTYTPYYVGKPVTVDFSAYTFDYSKMLDHYSVSTPDENVTPMAELMLCAGVSVNMDYGIESSGANYNLAPIAMVNNFGFDKGIRYLLRDYFGLDEWSDIIYSELKEGRPVMYGGANERVAHAFICDGLHDNEYFHMNWGQHGYQNGYFLLTALNFGEDGSSGSTAGYNTDQLVITDIRPAIEGSIIRPVLEFTSDFSVENAEYDRTATGQVVFYDPHGIYNRSIGTVEACFGLKILAPDGTVTYAESTQPQTLARGDIASTFTIPMNAFPAEGSYVVSPVVRNGSGEWEDGLVKLSNQMRLNVECSDAQIVFSEAEEAAIEVSDLRLTTPLFSGKRSIVAATLTNNSNEEYYEEVRPMLVRNNRFIAESDPLDVDVFPGESLPNEWVGTFGGTLTEGEYRLYLVDTKGKKLSRAVTVNVESPIYDREVVNTTVTFGPDRVAGATADKPAEITKEDFSVNIGLECTEGYFFDKLWGLVYYNTTGVMELYGSYIGISEGQSGSVEIKDAGDWIHPGAVYTVYPYGVDHGRFAAPAYFRVTTSSAEAPGADRAEAVTLRPNPARENLTVESGSPLGEVRVYSLSGAELLVAAGGDDMTVTLDVSGLPAGLYMVKVTGADGAVNTAKLIKR